MSGKKEKPKTWWWKVLGIFLPSPTKIAFLVILFCIAGLRFSYSKSGATQIPTFDWVSRIENAFLDVRFLLRGPKEPSGKIGILAIDDETIQKFGRWPLNRSSYEKTFQVLKKSGVKWVGVDVLFTEAERPLLEDSIPGIQEALDEAIGSEGFSMDKFEEKFAPLMEVSLGDKSLSRAFSGFENVVQSFYFYERGSEKGASVDWAAELEKVAPSVIEMAGMQPGVNKKLEDYKSLMSHGLLANIPVLASSTKHFGFTNNEARSPDGMARSVGLVKLIAPRDPQTGELLSEPVFFPNLSLSIAANYLNRIPLVEMDEIGVAKVQLMDPDGNKPPLDIPLVANSRGWVHLNHYGPMGTIPHISFAKVAEGKLPKKMPEILFMGATATGTTDVLASPFARDFYAVEHLAALTENIITKNFLKRPENASLYEVIALIVSGLLFALVLHKTTALRSLAMLVVFLAGAFFIDKYFLFGRGYWFYLGTLYVQSFGIFVSVIVFKYFTEEKEKKKVKNAFQHYLNPAVINQVLEHPDMLKLGGEKKELTVFFSDVRSFSTISESLSPEALTQLLNEYFTPMTQIVLDSGGLLDKYIGDAIMAVWGAPIDLPDQADRAVESCIRMLDALDVLREGWRKRGLPVLDIGIGLNTGPMTVGNMGGDQRFDYTVLGDAVNLASRLEGTTKEYRTKTIISEYTRKALKNPNRFLLRELDYLVVKGKTEPVTIFEVLRARPGQQDRAVQVIQMFQEGLALYRKQEWLKAEAMFAEILRIDPQDGPALTFIERCKYLTEHAPGESWDGVWVMKHK